MHDLAQTADTLMRVLEQLAIAAVVNDLMTVARLTFLVFGTRSGDAMTLAERTIAPQAAP